MDSLLVATPEPPYYAVIFSSTMNDSPKGYYEMADEMLALAEQQAGFLGVESARENIGITVSYWRTLEDIKHWKENSQHSIAQKLGCDRWYKNFTVRISKVERSYGF